MLEDWEKQNVLGLPDEPSVLTQEAAAAKPSGLLNHQSAPGPGASLAELHHSGQTPPLD